MLGIRHTAKGLDPKAVRYLQPGDPLLGDQPVFPVEGNQIGDRTDCGQIQQMVWKLPVESVGELQSHTDPCQFLEWIGAPFHFRMDHGEDRRQFRTRFMVIRQDQVDAKFFGKLGLSHCGYTGIHRDDNGEPFISSPSEGFFIRSVSFGEPVGDIKFRLCSEISQYRHQDRGGTYAVGIIVTIHKDALLLLDCQHDAVFRFLHIIKKKWIMKRSACIK